MKHTHNHRGHDRRLFDESDVKPVERLASQLLVEPPCPQGYAVIGMACRFPGGAHTPEQFWKLLNANQLCRDTMGVVPVSRFKTQKALQQGHIRTNRGAFLDDSVLDLFSAEHFGISLQEARMMNPYQRVVLETVTEALSSCNRLHVKNTGVFVGIQSIDMTTPPDLLSAYAATGTSLAIVANRVSYQLGFTGPSMSIDTACSSSMSALDAACKALANGDCTQAVVVGVDLLLTLDSYKMTSAAQMLSTNGRCATFSDQADGYARGEGCGVILLTPVATAVQERLPTWAIVASVALNQDGHSANLTSPNGLSQQAVIRKALHQARLTPGDIDFIETHGTGTALGDPLEVEALADVFNDGRKRCLGAVKTVVGHLEAASGMVGLIKTILCLHKQQLTPNWGHQEARLNHLLKRFTDCFDFQPGHQSVTLRAAGVSSFGFGGTNGHAILCACSNDLEPFDTQRHDCVEMERIPLNIQDPGGGNVESADYDMTTYTYNDTLYHQFVLKENTIRFLQDHQVRSVSVVPATCYVELLVPIVAQLWDPQLAFCVEDCHFMQMLYLDRHDRSLTIRVGVNRDTGFCCVESRQHQQWMCHATLRVQRSFHTVPPPLSLDSLVASAHVLDAGKAFYDTLGNCYAGEFASLKRVFKISTDEWLGLITDFQCNDDVDTSSTLRRYALFDACTHTAMMTFTEQQRQHGLYAEHVEAYHMRDALRSVVDQRIWCRAICVENMIWTFHVYNSKGEWLCTIEKMTIGLLQRPDGAKLPTRLIHRWINSDAVTTPERTLKNDNDFLVIRPVSALDLHLQYTQPTLLSHPLSTTIVPLLIQVPLDGNDVVGYVRSLRCEYPQKVIHLIWTDESNMLVSDLGLPDSALTRSEDWQWSSQTLTRRTLVPCSIETTTSLSIKKEGTYLVTGGLGYVGQRLTQALLDAGAQHLVILTRTRNDNNRFSEDPRVNVVACDVSDKDQVSQIVNELQHSLKGVVHAAGTLSDAAITNLHPQHFQQVWTAKVDGANHLLSSTLQCPLDFVVLCSSVAASLGSICQANYAAANAALDALARRMMHDRPVLSIQWGPWGGGGGLASPHIERLTSRMDIGVVSPDIGAKLFLQLLGTTGVRCVCPIRPHRSTNQTSHQPSQDHLQQSEQISVRLQRDSYERSQQHTETSPLLDQVLSVVAGVAPITLDHDNPDLSHMNWHTLSFDSLSLIELRNELHKVVLRDDKRHLLTENAFFEATTPALLAKYLENIQERDERRHLETIRQMPLNLHLFGQYFTRPDVHDLRSLYTYQELSSMSGFVFGRYGYGQVEIHDAVDLTTTHELMCRCFEKTPEGIPYLIADLPWDATITLHDVFMEDLPNDMRKELLEEIFDHPGFISYDEETGVWKYRQRGVVFRDV